MNINQDFSNIPAGFLTDFFRNPKWKYQVLPAGVGAVKKSTLLSRERRAMQKLGDGIYIHRNKLIIRDAQGICVEGCLHLFETFSDARAYIDKTYDGRSKKEPVIVGEWSAEEAGY